MAMYHGNTMLKSWLDNPHMGTPAWFYLLSGPYRIPLLSGPIWRRTDAGRGPNMAGEQGGPIREPQDVLTGMALLAKTLHE